MKGNDGWSWPPLRGTTQLPGLEIRENRREDWEIMVRIETKEIKTGSNKGKDK